MKPMTEKDLNAIEQNVNEIEAKLPQIDPFSEDGKDYLWSALEALIGDVRSLVGFVREVQKK